ncbi:MAG: hypothetical protein ACFFE5_04280 [Candidatus Thorarchaeota archaeon]
MAQIEIFPNKCIKCKRTDVELHKFRYGASRGTRTVSINLPVCSLCKPEFEKAYKIENALNTMKYISIISFIVTIFMIISLISGIRSTVNNLILIVTLVLAIIGIGLYIRLRVDAFRIKNYIVLSKNGEIIFKDQEYRQEIIDYIIKQEEEKVKKLSTGIGTIYCPKCGSQQIRGIDFCNNCGKELRDL